MKGNFCLGYENCMKEKTLSLPDEYKISNLQYLMMIIFVIIYYENINKFTCY